MNIVLAPYKDPSEGLDWPEQTPVILNAINARLRGWDDGTLEYQLRETNHGRGADWPTITVSILSLAGAAFFTIPAAHKKVRESLEEWKRIGANLNRLVARLAPRSEVAAFPVELIFFDAVESALRIDESGLLEFLSVQELPVPSEISGGFDHLKYYLFTFRAHERIVLVAIDNGRRVLWVRTT